VIFDHPSRFGLAGLVLRLSQLIGQPENHAIGEGNISSRPQRAGARRQAAGTSENKDEGTRPMLGSQTFEGRSTTLTLVAVLLPGGAPTYICRRLADPK
jgi:hypothetical protein